VNDEAAVILLYGLALVGLLNLALFVFRALEELVSEARRGRHRAE
jgi:hypothetical protein